MSEEVNFMDLVAGKLRRRKEAIHGVIYEARLCFSVYSPREDDRWRIDVFRLRNGKWQPVLSTTFTTYVRARQFWPHAVTAALTTGE